MKKQSIHALRRSCWASLNDAQYNGRPIIYKHGFSPGTVSKLTVLFSYAYYSLSSKCTSRSTYFIYVSLRLAFDLASFVVNICATDTSAGQVTNSSYNFISASSHTN